MNPVQSLSPPSGRKTVTICALRETIYVLYKALVPTIEGGGVALYKLVLQHTEWVAKRVALLPALPLDHPRDSASKWVMNAATSSLGDSVTVSFKDLLFVYVENSPFFQVAIPPGATPSSPLVSGSHLFVWAGELYIFRLDDLAKPIAKFKADLPAATFVGWHNTGPNATTLMVMQVGLAMAVYCVDVSLKTDLLAQIQVNFLPPVQACIVFGDRILLGDSAGSVYWLSISRAKMLQEERLHEAAISVRVQLVPFIQSAQYLSLAGEYLISSGPFRLKCWKSRD